MVTTNGRITGCLVVLVALAGEFTNAQTVIMPLGDSITQGGNGFASYRYPLWFDLQNAGYDVDFAGQRDFTNGGKPTGAWYPDYYTTFDRDHEGYWGWRTDEIAGIINAATTAAQPDIVPIHLGTNDIGQMGASGVTNADTNLRTIITSIRAIRPNVTILLAQVTPIGEGTSYFANADQVAPLNQVIATIVSDLDTVDSPVLLVDQNSGFDLGTMMQSDGLHPNLLGEETMADVWLQTLATVLVAGNPAPTISITSPIDGTSFESGDAINIEADAQDANGTVTQVEFFAGADSLGIDTDEPYTVTWAAPDIGSYMLTAVATDNEGAMRTSSSVSIAVLPQSGTSLLTVNNNSFESPILSDGTLASGPGVVGDWTFSGTANTFVGIFNPPIGSYPDADGIGTPAGADGINVAFLFNNGGPAESVSAEQLLASVLEPATEYTLVVSIGKFLPDQPYVFSTYGGYTIELLAGTTVIASDADSIEADFGEFRDAVATVDSSQLDPALIGQPLSVRLNISATEMSRSTHFDNVQLYAAPSSGAGVPATSAWGLAIMLLMTTVVATVTWK